MLATPISPQSIIFLSGEAGKAQVDSLPTTDAEPDGMGEAVGGLVGGVVGAGTGLSIGSAIASLFVPGVGTIFAIGLGAAALLGIGGAAAGATAGEASEHAADTGVPKDDVLIYRELLRRGRSLVIANVEDNDLASAATTIFHRLGAEDVGGGEEEPETGSLAGLILSSYFLRLRFCGLDRSRSPLRCEPSPPPPPPPKKKKKKFQNFSSVPPVRM